MRNAPLKQLGDDELEFARKLRDLGMDRRVAQTLVFLASVNEAGSRDIEVGAALRQPEVSIATTTLIDRGWVEYRELRPGVKGRPLKIYRLTTNLHDIINCIEARKIEKQASIEGTLTKLKKQAQELRMKH